MSHHSPATMGRPPLRHPDRKSELAERETIALRTKDGYHAIDARVLSKRPDRIQIMLHEGAHTVFCELKPTADALAYVGVSLGREIVYERSRAEVEADVAESGSVESDSPRW
jgi:hypothetical protein